MPFAIAPATEAARGFTVQPTAAPPPQPAPGDFVQWMLEGEPLGDNRATVIDFVGDNILASRGVGRNSHVITVRKVSESAPPPPPPPPPPPAPAAGFYGLVSSGTASYEVFNVFEPNGDDSTPLDPSLILGAYDAQRRFQAATAAGAPYTLESLSATAEGAVLQDFTDATSSVVVTVSATTGNIANVPPGTTDGGGRYSVPWTPDDLPTPTPADGGSKLLVIQTNGAVVTFTFSQPMCGFGLYLTDYLDFGGSCTWRFFSGLTELSSFVIVPQDVDENLVGTSLRDGSVGFVGFVSNTTAAPFDRMTMTFSATGVDRTGFDNIFVATLAGRPLLSIAAGSTVQFTDTSTGTPTSWLWNFGDATTSTLQNPTKTYSTPGDYTVTLTATNAGGSDTETKTGYIVVT